MDAYKPYLEYLLAGAVCETAYILSTEGVICATNLPIKQMPKYNFALVDDKDPSKTHNVVVDERANLLSALSNNGVCKDPAGIRLYNQKYYLSHFDGAPYDAVKSMYLKKEKGGACVVVTKKFILVGTFNSELKMQNGVAQNPGQLNKRVEGLAKNIFKQGS